MKYLVVGDLHVHPWSAFPANNGYLDIVRRFFMDFLAPLTARVDEVVFLGDLADEPYKRGKIRVDVHNLLHAMFWYTLVRPGVTTTVLCGNHDATGERSSWLSFLDHDADVSVVDAGCTDVSGEYRTVYIGYHADKTELIRALMDSPGEGNILFGHHTYEGFGVDPGNSMPDAVAKKFRLNVVGHLHSAPPYRSQLANVMHVLPPIPFAFGMQHNPVIILDSETLAVEPHVFRDSPQFITLPADYAVSKATEIPAGAIVRVTKARGDVPKAAALREARPDLCVYEQLEDFVKDAAIEQTVAAITDQRDVEALLRKYIEHTNQGLDPVRLLQVGMEALK